MGVTRDDLKNYTKMRLDLESLDLQIEAAYDTYKSPQLSAQNGGGPRDPGDPVARALQRLEKLRAQRQELVQRMIEIEDFVSNIDDWYERAICRIHYIEGFTWEATCLRLRKHHSISVITSYDSAWWQNNRQG